MNQLIREVLCLGSPNSHLLLVAGVVRPTRLNIASGQGSRDETAGGQMS